MSEHPEFARISLAAAEALADEGMTDLAVYLPSPDRESAVLYRGAGRNLSQPDFERMRRHGTPFLLVRSGVLRECEQVLEAKLSDLLKDPDLVPGDKAKLVHQVGSSVARDLADGPVRTNDVARASRVIDHVIGSVLDDPIVAGHLLHMAEHERSTASHMFVVSALAVMLGSEHFGPDHAILGELGLAGMMHDLGKVGIDPKVLNKVTALTPEETKLIHQHPVESVRLIGDAPDATLAVRRMILQHHERVDGLGYPLGVSGPDLLPGSRVLSVVDSFHAMIGQRPYRAPLSLPQANRALMAQVDRQFDAEILATWAQCFEQWYSPDMSAEPVEFDGSGPTVQSHNEHRPTTPAGGVFGPRPQRFPCHGRVSVKCLCNGQLTDATAGPDEFYSAIRDISRGGLCICTAHPMYRGELVDVELEPGEHPIWMRGVVAWCRQQDVNLYRVGLRFDRRLAEKPEAASVDSTGESSSGRAPCDHADAGESTSVTEELMVASQANDPTREAAEAQLKAIAAMRSVSLEAERSVVALSESPDPEIRRQTIPILANVGSKPTRAALVRLLKDDHTDVLTEAIAITGTLAMTEASYQLRRLLRHSDRSVVLRAAGALGRLGEDVGVPLVIEQLKAEDPHTRLAARVFGEIVGHRFPANSEGVRAARRYLAAKGGTLPAS